MGDIEETRLFNTHTKTIAVIGTEMIGTEYQEDSIEEENDEGESIEEVNVKEDIIEENPGGILFDNYSTEFTQSVGEAQEDDYDGALEGEAQEVDYDGALEDEAQEGDYDDGALEDGVPEVDYDGALEGDGRSRTFLDAFKESAGLLRGESEELEEPPEKLSEESYELGEIPPPVEVKIEAVEEGESEQIIDISSFTDGLYICEVCKKDKTTYYNLATHRTKVHKLPYRQERLGPNGEISSYVLHPERKLFDKELPPSVYICEVCRKDCHNYTNLGSHRKLIHKLPYRQQNLGENGEFFSIDLHHKKTSSTRANSDSIYVCEVCERDYKSYRNLGDHRRRFHKLPFRQERLGINGEISSHERHPEIKNLMVATADSIYVCEVCKNDYKTFTKLKYHRKHTHKIEARQDSLGLEGEIPTESLHPMPKNRTVKSPKSKVQKAVKAEIKLDIKLEPNEEPMYVCEVCLKASKSYRHLGDHRRFAHKLPFRQEMLGSNFDISSFKLHPGKTAASFVSDSNSVYVCEVCKNDYKTYAKLKYHRKNTHNITPREYLGLDGSIPTDSLHPLPKSQRRPPITSNKLLRKGRTASTLEDLDDEEDPLSLTGAPLEAVYIKSEPSE